MLAGKLFRGLAALVTVLGAVSGGMYIKMSGALAPGPLSETSTDGEISGGFVSHADFEKDCGHCHAPVHCLEEERCTECHFDIAQQRTDAVGLHGRLPAGRCQTCHTEHQGRDAMITTFAFANVDHMALAQFSLDQHRSDYTGDPLHCDGCHSQAQYMDESLDCVTCHMNESASYIAGHMEEYGPNCVDCHDGLDRMREFDHASSYALEGAHAAAPCETCHTDQAYSGTPRECVACHEDPEVHAGSFGTDCARCHDSAAWSPAQLTQHTFQLNHGAEENRPCQDCHVESYAGYICTNCHDHEPQAMIEVHNDYQIYEFEDCASCHPTGAAGEAAVNYRNPKEWPPEGSGAHPGNEQPGPGGEGIETGSGQAGGSSGEGGGR